MNTLDSILEGQLLDESTWFGLGEFCAVLRVERYWVSELVEGGLLEPQGQGPEQWRFSPGALLRARLTARLVGDLDVNLAGAAVILDLLEERRELRQRLRRAERLLADLAP